MFEQATSVPIDVMTRRHPGRARPRRGRRDGAGTALIPGLDAASVDDARPVPHLRGVRRRTTPSRPDFRDDVGAVGDSRRRHPGRHPVRGAGPHPGPGPEPGLARRRRHRYRAVARRTPRRWWHRGRVTSSARSGCHPARGRLRADGDRRRGAGRGPRRGRCGSRRRSPADALDHRRRPAGRRPGRHPPFTTAELAPGWLALARDPRPLLGLPASDAAEPRDLLTRRTKSFARVQEHYYADPPQIERGRRHYLMSTRGSGVPRHGQQRHRAGACPPAGRGDRGPAVAQAEHQLPLQLRGRRRVQRTARRHPAGPAGHRVPGQLRFGGKRSGAPAGDRGVRAAATCSPSARPTTGGRTRPTRCRRRPPTTRTHSPHGRTGSIRWSRPTAFAAGTAATDAGRYAPDAVAQVEELVAAGRPPAGFICESVYGNAGGMALPDGYLRAGLRRGARGGRARRRRRGAGRLRPTRRVVLGISSAGGGARHRVDREVDGQRLPTRRRHHQPRDRRGVQLAGVLLLLDRRQSAVLRDRPHRARRAARRGPAGQCDAGGRPSARPR